MPLLRTNRSRPQVIIPHRGRGVRISISPTKGAWRCSRSTAPRAPRPSRSRASFWPSPRRSRLARRVTRRAPRPWWWCFSWPRATFAAGGALPGRRSYLFEKPAFRRRETPPKRAPRRLAELSRRPQAHRADARAAAREDVDGAAKGPERPGPRRDRARVSSASRHDGFRVASRGGRGGATERLSVAAATRWQQ